MGTDLDKYCQSVCFCGLEEVDTQCKTLLQCDGNANKLKSVERKSEVRLDSEVRLVLKMTAIPPPREAQHLVQHSVLL